MTYGMIDGIRRGARCLAGGLSHWSATALVAMVLGGCATSGGDVPDCTDPESASLDYVVGSGDVLKIFVWRNPELTSSVPVRPDGKISIPLIEDMPAVGKTPTQLARDIEDQLGQFLRSPEVYIIVTSPGSSNQVQVIGQVSAPRSLPYTAELRVLDVLVAVGGLSEFAAGNRSKIVRRLDGVTAECRVRLGDLVEDGDLSQNVRVLPGDVIVVPEARF